MPQAAEIGEALAIGREERREIARAALDVLVHRQALDDAPVEAVAGVGDHRLPGADGLDAPDLAVGDLVERGDDAAGAGLGDLVEADPVERSEPAPAFLHPAILATLRPRAAGPEGGQSVGHSVAEAGVARKGLRKDLAQVEECRDPRRGVGRAVRQGAQALGERVAHVDRLRRDSSMPPT